ncbi:CD5 antigen-like isoform X2 [Pomacea canaliculata]|uniref:CD5 antigen-like isoform X2 n=1 Tax=Pomacea canaliculata TaxID=400727 RepID=UPI000D73A69C|nr:CD5 antigen-like isoform X2 [Pomacea canaliculata]
MKTGIFIDMVSISETSVVGKIAFRYSLLFWVNVTSRIKESVARRVLELEAGRVLVFKDIQIPILGYMGIFDTKDQMIYSPKTDTIDWCSSPSLFSCRNHSTCVDYGLRYSCPCKVGYYDNNNNECNLAVRLGGVQEKLEGRLEFYTNGTWRTICQRGFTSQTAVVACRQLGLPSRGAVYYEGAVYGEGTGDVHMYRMTCTGRELALSQCPSEPLASGSCNHSMDVGIRCDKVCVDDYHFGLNCSQPCVCNVSNTDLCDRDNGTCYCKAGWEGVTCDDDVDECAQTGACRGPLERCQNTQGSFLCLCEEEAERNEGGVCIGTDEMAASASSGLSFARHRRCSL